MDNQKIAEVFQEIGDILEIQGENRFRIIAYQRAALIISELGRDLKDIYTKDPRELENIAGIGKDLAAKIVELITTGKCKFHSDLLKHFPHGLLEMLHVRGVGPKKVKLFWSELNIDSVEKLRKAAMKGALRELPGMGEKSEAEILKALGEYDRHTERMLISDAMHEAEKIIGYLKGCKQVGRIEYAGSLRRMKETIGDLDILVTPKGDSAGSASASASAHKIMDFFVKFEEVADTIAKGETKTSVILKSGIQCDLRVIEDAVFGAALHYFTGSKEHNIAIRDRAKKKGLKVSEYGVFKLIKKRGGKDEEKLVAGKTEDELFKSVGLPYIAPTLRENRGEIEAGEKKRLPKIIQAEDIRSDLHTHSKWSDGTQEIEDHARAYKNAGYEFIALTDHSKNLVVAHGLDPERYEMQWDEIDLLNTEFAKESQRKKKSETAFTILKGTECDILPDGSLDLPDKTLKKMDLVIGAVHTSFKMSEKEMTNRIIKAIKSGHVNILAHPTGRIINQREPYAVDMEAVMDAAVKYNVALEINSQPLRLDLYDYYCKIAREKGCKFAIDTDAHHSSQMAFLRYGIAVAQRGWLTKEDVINCMPLKDLKKWLNK